MHYWATTAMTMDDAEATNHMAPEASTLVPAFLPS